MRAEFDLFMHHEGSAPRSVRASAGEPLAEVLKRAALALGPDVFVFVGESEDAQADDRAEDGGEDDHEPADPSLAVAALGLHRGGHGVPPTRAGPACSFWHLRNWGIAGPCTPDAGVLDEAAIRCEA
jgi:hypothetical protein